MTTTEILKFIFDNFEFNSFTGNELVKRFGFNHNQIHLQLYNISKKTDKLQRYLKDQQVYYFLKP